MFRERKEAMAAAGEQVDTTWVADAGAVLQQLSEQPESEPFREPVVESDVR